MDDDGGDEWQWRFGDGVVLDGDEISNAPYVKIAYTCEDLLPVMSRIGKSEGVDLIDDYRARSELVKTNMGTLCLCQFDRGEMLRVVGAIDSLLSTLFEIRPLISYGDRIDAQTAAFDLAIPCWQALRDLACGSIGNRTAIRLYRQGDINGLELMISYLKAFDSLSWHEMDELSLFLVTAVIGAMRNVSHKTRVNCQVLHENGASILLIRRLLSGPHTGNSLPEQSQPWREGSYRAVGSLLNIAEEYGPCLELCSSNADLISILVESWGCNKRLKSVFQSLLQSAKSTLPTDQYNAAWDECLL